ncbi:MAG: hypothetical protein WCD07_05335 [Burkholderiales bacterium]
MPTEAQTKNERTNNIIKKNLGAKEAIAEEVEKIIIEGTRDPENLSKKKKTIKQVFDSVLPPVDDGSVSYSGVDPSGGRYTCLKKCVGPQCCTSSGGARTYLSPGTEHKYALPALRRFRLSFWFTIIPTEYYGLSRRT